MDTKRFSVPGARISFDVPPSWRSRQSSRAGERFIEWRESDAEYLMLLWGPPFPGNSLQDMLQEFPVIQSRTYGDVTGYEVRIPSATYGSVRKLGLHVDGFDFFFTFPEGGDVDGLWEQIKDSITIEP